MALGREQILSRRFGKWCAQVRAAGSPIYARKIAGGRFQRVGLPDWWLCVAGQFVLIELKSPDIEAAPSPLQGKEMAEAAECGALVYCCNTFEDARNYVLDILTERMNNG